jgi:hypothetical protein
MKRSIRSPLERGVGVDWVYMEWGGGLMNPPDPLGYVRVLTLDCATIGLFEVRKGGGEPRVLVDELGNATVTYAGGHNPEYSISESDAVCPSAAVVGQSAHVTLRDAD